MINPVFRFVLFFCSARETGTCVSLYVPLFVYEPLRRRNDVSLHIRKFDPFLWRHFFSDFLNGSNADSKPVVIQRQSPTSTLSPQQPSVLLPDHHLHFQSRTMAACESVCLLYSPSLTQLHSAPFPFIPFVCLLRVDKYECLCALKRTITHIESKLQ